MIRSIVTLLLSASVAATVHGQAAGTIVVVVTSAEGVVEKAEVRAGSVSATTASDGTASLSVPAGRVDVVVTRSGYRRGRRVSGGQGRRSDARGG